jgi:hypothetical protein
VLFQRYVHPTQYALLEWAPAEKPGCELDERLESLPSDTASPLSAAVECAEFRLVGSVSSLLALRWVVWLLWVACSGWFVSELVRSGIEAGWAAFCGAAFGLLPGFQGMILMGDLPGMLAIVAALLAARFVDFRRPWTRRSAAGAGLLQLSFFLGSPQAACFLLPGAFQGLLARGVDPVAVRRRSRTEGLLFVGSAVAYFLLSLCWHAPSAQERVPAHGPVLQVFFLLASRLTVALQAIEASLCLWSIRPNAVWAAAFFLLLVLSVIWESYRYIESSRAASGGQQFRAGCASWAVAAGAALACWFLFPLRGASQRFVLPLAALWCLFGIWRFRIAGQVVRSRIGWLWAPVTSRIARLARSAGEPIAWLAQPAALPTLGVAWLAGIFALHLRSNVRFGADEIESVAQVLQPYSRGAVLVHIRAVPEDRATRGLQDEFGVSAGNQKAGALSGMARLVLDRTLASVSHRVIPCDSSLSACLSQHQREPNQYHLLKTEAKITTPGIASIDLLPFQVEPNRLDGTYSLIGGATYELDRDGHLWVDTSRWNGGRMHVEDSVRSLASYPVGTGYLFLLGEDGKLWIEAPFGGGDRIAIDAGVVAFAPSSADDGSVFVLGSDRQLWLERAGWARTGRTNVDDGVDAFAVSPLRNHVFVLGHDHKLWLESSDWHQQGRTLVDSNVRAFAREAGSQNLYVLGLDGNLWREAPDWSRWGRQWIAQSVVAFAPATRSRQVVYTLDSEGTLRSERLADPLYRRVVIDWQVRAFAPSLFEGYVYVLGQDTNFWLESADWHRLGRSWLSRGNPQAPMPYPTGRGVTREKLDSPSYAGKT